MLMAATIVQMERELRRLPQPGDPDQNFSNAMAGRRYADARTDDGIVFPDFARRFRPSPPSLTPRHSSRGPSATAVWADTEAWAEDESGERQLWTEVIMRALEDSQGRGPGLSDLEQHQARKWLALNNPHFNRACDLAGLEPSYVLRANADSPARRLAKAA